MTTKEQDVIEVVEKSNASANYLGADGLGISDGLDLIYKFIFDPRADFREITKLWSITDLKEEEVHRIVQLSKNIRILDNPRFYRSKKRKTWTGKVQQITNKRTGEITQKPIYIEEEVWESRFQDRLIQKYMGEIQAICASAGGRGSSVIRAFRTAAHQHHQSVEDKTAPRSSIADRIRGR